VIPPGRLYEIVFKLPPLITGNFRMNQIVPLEPDIDILIPEPVIA